MSPTASDPIGVALLVAAALDRVGASYHVGGSIASSLQGDPRSTNDIDFVIDLPLGQARDLVRELGADFELDADALLQALRTGTCCNAFYLPWLMKIDFFGHAHEPFDDSEFARKQKIEVRGAALFVKSAEDTILRKLLWYVQGGSVSERQWNDVLGVLRANAGSLDDAYLRDWARRLGVQKLLDNAQRAALEDG